MASSLTQNTFVQVYEFLYTTFRLLGTRYRPTIAKDFETDLIDEGVSFSVSGISTLADGASAYYLGKVNSSLVHFYNLAVNVSSGAISIELFEAPTITADGTAVNAVNLNRNVTTISHLTAFASPTVTDDGTLLFSTQIHSGGTNGKDSGSSLIDRQWLLKQNTDYLIKITNNSGALIDYSVSFTYYERNIGL